MENKKIKISDTSDVRDSENEVLLKTNRKILWQSRFLWRGIGEEDIRGDNSDFSFEH